ncbi:GTPase-activating protein S13, partial [Kappamyces sp. JEL0680]
VFIWKDQNGVWTKIKEHLIHTASVNSLSWAPHEWGLILACASSDGKISILTYKQAREENGSWKEEHSLQAHSDWVRDVAFAPNLGVGRTYLASCSQDKSVLIWTQDGPDEPWVKKPLGPPGTFSDVIWRVSWSLAGNLLAVACGDNKITLWKEGVDGEWAMVGDVNQTEGAPQ